MSEISIAAGYGSVRRFNDAFRNTYSRTPRELRGRRRETVTAAGVLSVRLPWRPPYDWDGMLDFLAGRATPGVEQVTDSRYLRTVAVHTDPLLVYQQFGIDGAQALQTEIEWLRSEGLTITIQ